jgi:hypothetical protein
MASSPPMALCWGQIGELVKLAFNSPAALHQLFNEGKEEHRWFELRWEPPRDQHGNPIFLQKLEPLVLREIQYIEIKGPCEFRISDDIAILKKALAQ